jgi:hypothetical protein
MGLVEFDADCDGRIGYMALFAMLAPAICGVEAVINIKVATPKISITRRISLIMQL